MSDHSPEARIEEVTPEMAEQWLAANCRAGFHNRKIHRRTMVSYARDMLNGKWRITGQPIILGADGSVLDGQHRLHAVISANIPITTLIVRHVDTAHEAVRHIDTGRPRSHADTLELRGVQNSHLASATIRLLYKIKVLKFNSLDGSGNVKITYAELDDFGSAYLEAISKWAWAAHACRGFFNPSLGCALAIQFAELDTMACSQFFEDIRDGALLSKTDPVLQLRELARHVSPFHLSRRISVTEQAHALINAWNLRREKRQTGALALRRRMQRTMQSGELPRPK